MSERSLREALDLARKQRERGAEALAIRMFGELAARRDPPAVAEAQAHSREALAIAESLGARPSIVYCRLRRGQLYRAAGRTAEARGELEAAASRFREMGPGLSLAEAERELAAVG